MASSGQDTRPVALREMFQCVHCGVVAGQTWMLLHYGARRDVTRVRRCVCVACGGESYWLMPDDGRATTEEPDALLLWPFRTPLAPQPHHDMPTEIRADYEEAATILERSPRGAAALLRLCLQKLLIALGLDKTINKAIGQLIADGLDPVVQQALDTVRVMGNESVHPGELDLRDDRDTALQLFSILNFIVDQRITQPRHIAAMYDLLPENKKRRGTPP